MSLRVMYNGQCTKPPRPLLIRGMPVDLFEAISSIYVMPHLMRHLLLLMKLIIQEGDPASSLRFVRGDALVGLISLKSVMPHLMRHLLLLMKLKIQEGDPASSLRFVRGDGLERFVSVNSMSCRTTMRHLLQ